MSVGNHTQGKADHELPGVKCDPKTYDSETFASKKCNLYFGAQVIDASKIRRVFRGKSQT